MIEYKAIKDKLELGKGKGAKGAEQAYFADGEGRRERYSSRSQGQGRGRGGGRGRSSSRGRGGGGRGGGGGGSGNRSGGPGGVEESKGSSSGGADGGGGGDYKFLGPCFQVWTSWTSSHRLRYQREGLRAVVISDAGGAGGPGGEESGDPGGDGGSDGDPGDSENLEELKYDPADDRYPRGLEGKKLLRGASNAGPLRHGLESGRTRRQTREMQGAGEMPGPGETPDPEAALLATILETGGTGIVEDYICYSLGKEQWDEEQTRRMEEMYRREMQEVLGPEQ
ncbi:unnamed protein product [Ectocarpus sp. CCAP 1310/34]|nr:unnamed protein product [Ectocarpus sp. CCAP 1310/34]